MKKIISLFTTFSLVAIAVMPTMVSAADRYRDFYHLASNEKEGRDFKIRYTDRKSDALIMAVHGGLIEEGTTEVAEEIANKGQYNFYTFMGTKSDYNFRDLHVTSANFNEPNAIRMAKSATQIVSVHGCVGNAPKVLMGGFDDTLGRKIATNLRHAGFVVEPAPVSLNGKCRANICNKGKTYRGVQLELTWGLRKHLISDREESTPTCQRFAKAIREAIGGNVTPANMTPIKKENPIKNTVKPAKTSIGLITKDSTTNPPHNVKAHKFNMKVLRVWNKVIKPNTHVIVLKVFLYKLF